MVSRLDLSTQDVVSGACADVLEPPVSNNINDLAYASPNVNKPYSGVSSDWLMAALAAAIVAVVACGMAFGQEIASTDKAEICASDGRGGSAYSRAHRVVWRKGHAGYENDHIVPLCLGGADTDANVVMQPLDEARQKDKLETYACREVCAGHIPLATAQAWFTGDWRAAYRQQFGRAP